jgi:dolichol-phosphate mannosyltransferase
VCFNFVRNRRFSFSLARQRPWLPQFFSYMAASSIGALINYAVTLFVLARITGLRPQAAAMIGIAAGTSFNFVTSRYLVFRLSHIRPPAND